ncbi:hypothetical protein GEMRC1_010925 [Eukaryota sp. GEM-RC1]
MLKKARKCLIDESQIMELSSLKDLLEPFYFSTMTFSAEKYQIFSIATICYYQLKVKLEALSETELRGCEWKRICVSNILTKLQKYNCHVMGFHAYVAIILDPRFKRKKLPVFLNTSGNFESLKCFLLTNYSDEVAKEVSIVTTTQEISESPANSTTFSFLSAVVEDSETEEEDTDETTVLTELTSYLAKPRSKTVNLDPLSYWKTASEYPRLSTCARDIFSIQPTSTPSERLFSLAGCIVTKKRSCLDPEMVQAILCLNSYRKVFRSRK